MHNVRVPAARSLEESRFVDRITKASIANDTVFLNQKDALEAGNIYNRKNRAAQLMEK